MRLAREVSTGSPALEQAFPTLYTRSPPVIERRSPLVYAASLLRFHSVEAAMMLTDGTQPMRMGDKIAFVGGYSILTTLLRTRPDLSYRALFEQCDHSAMAVTPVKSNRDLRDLLLVFQGGRFGFTAVTKGDMHAMVGLSDVLGLYQNGTLGSDLTVRDVASQPFSVDRQTSLKEALSLMLERRIRRVFIEGANAFVSDREIVSSLFSPRKLKQTKRLPRTMLEGSLLEVGPVESVRVGGETSLKEAALLVTRTQGGALTCEEGVVSPWDIVMKPFATGHLYVR